MKNDKSKLAGVVPQAVARPSIIAPPPQAPVVRAYVPAEGLDPLYAVLADEEGKPRFVRCVATGIVERVIDFNNPGKNKLETRVFHQSVGFIPWGRLVAADSLPIHLGYTYREPGTGDFLPPPAGSWFTMAEERALKLREEELKRQQSAILQPDKTIVNPFAN